MLGMGERERESIFLNEWPLDLISGTPRGTCWGGGGGGGGGGCILC